MPQHLPSVSRDELTRAVVERQRPAIGWSAVLGPHWPQPGWEQTGSCGSGQLASTGSTGTIPTWAAAPVEQPPQRLPQSFSNEGLAGRSRRGDASGVSIGASRKSPVRAIFVRHPGESLQFGGVSLA